ncbi:MAG: hypothetical protein QG622_3187 [Actinomycetota bacterium]|nr:hypothetical protein [Actinomycetota bacterium]
MTTHALGVGHPVTYGRAPPEDFVSGTGDVVRKYLAGTGTIILDGWPQ